MSYDAWRTMGPDEVEDMGPPLHPGYDGAPVFSGYCRCCGAELSSLEHVYCDRCNDQIWADIYAEEPR